MMILGTQGFEAQLIRRHRIVVVNDVRTTFVKSNMDTLILIFVAITEVVSVQGVLSNGNAIEEIELVNSSLPRFNVFKH